MNTLRSVALSLLSLALVGLVVANGQLAQGQSTDQLGTVNFQNSCGPAVQANFQRSVAMLHSFRYGEAEKAFREVLAQDPSCAIATWGIAAHPDVQSARRHRALHRKGPSARRRPSTRGERSARRPRASATTSRPWPPTTRTGPTGRSARARPTAPRRSRRWPRAIPNDDEAQIFYALYLAATQSLADQTYAAYLKAADILEKQFVEVSGPSRASRTT